MNDGQSGGPDPVEALRLLANKEKDRKVPVSEIISSACALVLALEPAERADGLSASARRIRGRLWTLLSRPEKLPFGQLDAFGEFAGELQQLYGGYLSYAEDAPLLYPDAFPTAEVPRGLSRMQWRALVRESGMLQVLAAGRTGRDGLIAAIELAENVFGWCADRQELSNGELCMALEGAISPERAVSRAPSDEATAAREQRLGAMAARKRGTAQVGGGFGSNNRTPQFTPQQTPQIPGRMQNSGQSNERHRRSSRFHPAGKDGDRAAGEAECPAAFLFARWSLLALHDSHLAAARKVCEHRQVCCGSRCSRIGERPLARAQNDLSRLRGGRTHFDEPRRRRQGRGGERGGGARCLGPRWIREGGRRGGGWGC
ncbi:hypothetical protein T492DRAFT_917073, partial [Pavlovales sp. CCMP2436]